MWRERERERERERKREEKRGSFNLLLNCLNVDLIYSCFLFIVNRVIEIAGINTKGIGTPFYMCPEVIQGKAYDQKVHVPGSVC